MAANTKTCCPTKGQGALEVTSNRVDTGTNGLPGSGGGVVGPELKFATASGKPFAPKTVLSGLNM